MYRRFLTSTLFYSLHVLIILISSVIIRSVSPSQSLVQLFSAPLFELTVLGMISHYTLKQLLVIMILIVDLLAMTAEEKCSSVAELCGRSVIRVYSNAVKMQSMSENRV